MRYTGLLRGLFFLIGSIFLLSASWASGFAGVVSVQGPGAAPAPITNAVVVAMSRGQIVSTTTTDASGDYSMSGLPAGTYTLSFLAPNFLIAKLSSYAIADGATANVDAGLTPLLLVSQSTSNGNSRSWTISNGNSFPVTYTWTLGGNGVQGSGTAVAPPGDSTLTTPGRAASLNVFVNNNSVRTLSITVVKPPAFKTGIAGQVTNAANVPLAGVGVVVLNSSGQTAGTTATLADGSYGVGNLSPGTYFVTFSLAGYLNYNAANVQVVSGSTTEIDPTLIPKPTPGSVSGTVQDGSGNPEVALVSLVNGNNNTVASATANGTFTFTNIDAGNYTLTASANGYQPFSTPVSVAGNGSNTQVAISLVANPVPVAASVYVKVVDAGSGNGIGNSVVTITYVGDPTVGSGTTDSTGGTTITSQPVGVPANINVVVNEPITHKTLATINQSVGAGWVSGSNSITFDVSGGSVAGIVKDTYGNPIGGTTINLRDVNLNVVATAVSGQDGSFVIQNVEVGLYSATLGDATHDTLTVNGILVVSGQTTTISPALNPQIGVVQGIVSDSVTGAPINGAMVVMSNGNGNNFLQTTTNSVGNYGFSQAPVGTWLITISATGYTTASGWVTITQNGTATLNFSMTPGASLMNIDWILHAPLVSYKL